MVDIDNLKFVNDNFGHAKGDELLKRLANILSSIFRKESNQKSELKLSVSLGYAVQYGQYKNMEEVLKKADQHMYRNKLLGDTIAQTRKVIS